MSKIDKGKGTATMQPTDWKVEDVISWLTTSGFDDDVRHRFRFHKITGKTLFRLDPCLLKSGMGIEVLNDQLDLLDAINELRLKAPTEQPGPESFHKHPKHASSFSSHEGRDRQHYRLSPQGNNSVSAHAISAREEYFPQLYSLFWGVSQSPHFVVNSATIPDARSLEVGDLQSKFTTINLPGQTRFPDGASVVLVTKIFELLWGKLRDDDVDWERVQGSTMPAPASCRSTVVSGQPGIGKTMFLNYVLVRRLQEKKMTIYCDRPSSAHVFTEYGVRKIDLNVERRILELDSNPLCCALINLGGALPQPPLQFYPTHRKGKVVLATPPNPDHMKRFKEFKPITYYMPTWNWDDLYCGGLVHVGKISSMTQDTTVEEEHNESLREAYWRFAGVPRICYKAFWKGDMRRHLLDVDTALTNVTSLEDFARSMNGLEPFKNAATHTLVKIEPVPDTNWEKPQTELISAYISGLVFDRVRTHPSTLSETISGLLLSPDTRGHAGKLFEQAAHRAFEKGMKIKPIPITEQAPVFTTTIHKVDETASEVVHYFYTLSIRACEGSPAVNDKYFNHYLIPISKTQESVDSVLVSQKFTLLFQMTVWPRTQGIKFQGIVNILKGLPENAKKDVRIVFVLPAGCEDKSFGRQNITHIPHGTPAEEVEEVESYHQYVYRLSFKSLKMGRKRL